MGRKFLCCLPLAVGAWLFTFLFLTWGIALSVIGWYAYAKHDDAGFNLVLTRDQKVSLIVTTVCWSILPVACLFGIGAIISRSYRALSFYSSLLQFQWGASIGSGAYFIYTLYRKGGNREFQHDCENRAKLSLDECRHAFNTLRAIVIAVYVVIWLIQLWGSVTINFYATEHKKQAEFGHLPLPGSVLPVNVNPYSMAPAPSLPLIGPAPAGRLSPDRSYGSDPRPSFVSGMAGASLPPPVGVDGAQSQYAFTTYNNARGTGEKA